MAFATELSMQKARFAAGRTQCANFLHFKRLNLIPKVATHSSTKASVLVEAAKASVLAVSPAVLV